MKTLLLTLCITASLFCHSQFFTSPYGDTATIFRISEREAKRCTITGPWSQVAEVFIKYWQTSYNQEEGKRGVVRYNISDKITFISNANGTGVITVLQNK